MLYIILFLQIAIESLPISSSGHLFVLQKFFPNATLSEHLEHLAHGPTFLIIAIFFQSQWVPLTKKILHVSSRDSYKMLCRIICKIIFFVIVSDSITTLFYFSKKIFLAEPIFITNNSITALGFLITAGLLFSLSFVPKRLSTLTTSKAILLGVAQGLALLPGISRFAITYTVARWLSIPHRRAFEISFLLQVPLIAAAFLRALVEVIMEVIMGKTLFYSWQTFVAVILAMITGYFLLELARRMAAQNKMWKFGIYVLIVSLLLTTIV